MQPLAHQLAKGVSGLGVPAAVDVQVALDRNTYRRMAKPLRHDLDGNPGLCAQ
jgi:hypothetical protein